MKKLWLLPAPASNEAGSRDLMTAMTVMQLVDTKSTQSSMCADSTSGSFHSIKAEVGWL